MDVFTNQKKVSGYRRSPRPERVQKLKRACKRDSPLKSVSNKAWVHKETFTAPFAQPDSIVGTKKTSNDKVSEAAFSLENVKKHT